MAITIVIGILLLVCMILFIAYLDSERECMHMKKYSVRQPGVKYIKKSWLRKGMSWLIDF